MPELSTDDLRGVLRAVRRVSGAATLAEFRHVVPELVLELVPGVRAGYNEIDRSTGQSYVSYSPVDEAADALADRFSHFALDHPTLQHIAATGDGSAVAISDVIDRDSFRRMPIYTELFSRIATEDQLVIALPSPRPLVIGVPVNRDSWGFSARDRLVMNELRPHLAQAHAAATTRQLLQQAIDARDAALDALGAGVARIEGGRVVDASPLAARWLRRGLLEGDRPTEDLLSWYTAERDRLRGADDDALPGLSMPLRTTDASERATLRFIGDGTIIVTERLGPPSSDDLARFGLTGAEASVLLQMIAGASTEQAASALFVVPDTVRKHLSSIYRKLGVHSRPAAVAYVLGALAEG